MYFKLIFRRESLLNKEKIQDSFEQFIEHHRTSDEEGYSEEYRAMFLEVCERFKDALEKCHLPVLAEDWWYYDYQQTNDGIELSLFLCEDLELNEEEDDIDSMTCSQNFTLVSAKCDYLSVEQYAQIQHVTPTTVFPGTDGTQKLLSACNLDVRAH